MLQLYAQMNACTYLFVCGIEQLHPALTLLSAPHPSKCLLAGFQLDEMAFATLFTTFDPECTSWLSIAEYIAMTLFLQSASATFEAFDQQKRGTVTFNFNQWIYASANVV